MSQKAETEANARKARRGPKAKTRWKETKEMNSKTTEAADISRPAETTPLEELEVRAALLQVAKVVKEVLLQAALVEETIPLEALVAKEALLQVVKEVKEVLPQVAKVAKEELLQEVRAAKEVLLLEDKEEMADPQETIPLLEARVATRVDKEEMADPQETIPLLEARVATRVDKEEMADPQETIPLLEAKVATWVDKEETANLQETILLEVSTSPQETKLLEETSKMANGT